MTIEQKRRIVAEVNCELKTYFKYIVKIDAVYEEFNRSAKPLPWNDWYARYKHEE